MEGSISGIAENEEGNNGEPHCRVERGDVQDRDESVDCVREIVSKMRIFQFLQTPLTSPRVALFLRGNSIVAEMTTITNSLTATQAMPHLQNSRHWLLSLRAFLRKLPSGQNLLYGSADGIERWSGRKSHEVIRQAATESVRSVSSADSFFCPGLRPTTLLKIAQPQQPHTC